jgi:pimeloyl-ACP methyl ester carboxylesterase
VEGFLKVPVVATNLDVLCPEPENNFELIEFITNFLRRGSDTFAKCAGGPVEVDRNFNIYSKLCVPADPEKTKELTSVQILTHGGTLDRSYWDFDQGYSYVDAAAEQGYATFSYDRLSAGKSEKPDPRQIVQAPVHTAIIHSMVKKLRKGEIGNVSFEKVVGLGHSLGSAVTQANTFNNPGDFDALVLTGHSSHLASLAPAFSSAAHQIANTVPDLPQFKHLSNGYFVFGPVLQAMQMPFFYYPFFDPQSKRHNLVNLRYVLKTAQS